MRIGSDFILFTKKAATMTCLMMSRTFHEEEKIEEVIVPLPSFDSQSKRALGKAGKALEKHKLEMDLIYKYSPFHTHESFMRSFDSIRGGSGTLVIIYNLKLMDNGQPELDVMTGSEDILLSQPHTADFDMEDG
ncbi:PREDICTED: MORC family CW-type zinc finger protein 2A-like [Priapulus caudatus]|uniref:MORC family CW-type zinc finger protein 2A-like n=1 Tax=Priapulus caudatus TaxID=37621 RepID=A0ABM1ESP6_PRICU|nr:PREDICTED: MORC family CW-type zinc finger protein 2A-like [Priapulus caudatus]